MPDYDISVIIPVYNAEKYLEECIESVLNQTKHGIELILIDDGSTDKSVSIIDFYAENYPNVVVHHQLNSGVGKARSVGYKLAKGKYIGWIDADDIAKPEMYDKLYQLAISENADYIYCNYEFYPQRSVTKSKWFKEYKGKKDGDFIDRNTQCWNTLVKKSLYEKVSIDSLLIEFGEYSWIAAMLTAEKVAFTNEPLYLYRVGHNSLSGGDLSGRVPYYKKCVNLSKNLKKIIAGTPYEESLDKYFDYRYIYTLLLLSIVAAKNSDKSAYMEAHSELKRMKYKSNPYLYFIGNDYGKLKSWVVRIIIPSNYFIASIVVKAAL